MNLLGKVIILAVILVIVYYLWKWWASGRMDSTYDMGGGPQSAMQDFSQPTIPAADLGDMNGTAYSFSVWILVQDWSYRIGEEKIIFTRAHASPNSGVTEAPKVSLDANTNDVHVTVTTQQPGGVTGDETCSVSNIPIQTWVNIITVVNGRALDVYIDGKLQRTCYLKGLPFLPALSDGGVFLCPANPGGDQYGFNGFVSSLRYFTYSLNPREAYEVYREGVMGLPSIGNIFEKYRIKIDFYKDNQKVGPGFEI